MTTICPPKYVSAVLRRLEGHDYKAFLVGGCVRDCIMGRRPNDWDICTDALPSEVSEVFPNTRPTGVKHGTVTVIEHGSHVEVTTFRTDGEYKDHRRPENVSFVSDLTADLARRDFTVNALALSSSGMLFDPFGGMADIESRLIRCVGDPNIRFEEDALRMLRAIRFSATLGFDIEEQTMNAIRANSHLSEALASERVCSEAEKILLSDCPQNFALLIDCGLMYRYVSNLALSSDLSLIAALPKKRALRWSALCALLRRDGIISSAESFLLSLRLDAATVRNASCGCEAVLEGAPRSKLEWKRLLAKHGTDCGKCAAASAELLYGGNYLRQLGAVTSSGDCYSLKRLNISGDDLLELGFSGPALGATLNSLLNYVLEHPAENVHSILMEKAAKML